MEPAFIHLQGRCSSVMIDVSRSDMPVWRHWGARLPDGIAPPGWDETVRAATFALDQPVPLSVFPLFGDGWFGPPALLAHRGQVQFAHAPASYRVDHSRQQALFTLSDPVAQLEISVELSLDAQTDVLSLRSGLVNLGDTPLDVGWMSAGCLPLPAHSRRVESFGGRHNQEWIASETALGLAGWHRENRRGLSSHDCPPMASVLGEGAGQASGPVWSAQLAWSGNHVQSIDPLGDGGWLWMAGEWLAPGEVRLAPGERLQSPQWLATYSLEGRDGAAQNFHAARRQRAPAAGTDGVARPVHLNTWEAVYFRHDEADLMDLASCAAGLGVERFVLDDGWFTGRRNDRCALGDWTADPVIYPRGLKPLGDHVSALGMGFGLWVEPEMISPDSALARAHPDWALQVEGRAPRTARHQLVLDLTRPEVCAFLFNALSRLLQEAPVTYLKWDHNRDLTQAANADGRPAYRAQVLAAYGLIDRLRAAFPGVEIEACAGGGGRADAGMLSRVHRVWTSDNVDPESRLVMQRNALQFLPPEVLGAHVGAAPNHATGRHHALAFRASVALSGHFGIELDPRRMDADERNELRGWIDCYKRLRGRFHSGKLWRGDAGDGLVWQAHGDATGFVLLIWRVQPTRLAVPPPVRLPFLAGEGDVALARVDPGCGQHDGPVSEAFLALERGKLRLNAAWLRESGLQLPFLKAQSAIIIEAAYP